MFNVRSSDDAAAVLSFFNGFHDAFVEPVVVVMSVKEMGTFGRYCGIKASSEH